MASKKSKKSAQKSPENSQVSAPLIQASRPRISSIDAFRGLTILMMIFVIRVASYQDLPLTFPHFGSSPVSTFKHADSESARGWAFYESGSTTSTVAPTHWRGGIVTTANPNGTYDIRLISNTGKNGTGPNEASLRSKNTPWTPELDTQLVAVASGVQVNTPKPLLVGDGVVVHLPHGPDPWNATFGANPPKADWRNYARFQAPKIGCTFTDLVAPFFVFIVGVVIPIGKAHRGPGWFGHALRRCLFLIAAGVTYLSLIGSLSLSWWWGILQAIGVAYLMGVILYQLPWMTRLAVLIALAAGHEYMTRSVHWWTELGDPNKYPMSLTNWRQARPMDAWRPLELHCTPWASIGYGICTVLGSFIGEAIKARTRIWQTCLAVGLPCLAIGLAMNYSGMPMHKEFVTASYAIFTSGIAAITYLVIYLIMDVAGWKLWAWPLEVFGQNALFAYFSQVLVGGILLDRLGVTAFFQNTSFSPGHPWFEAPWTLKYGMTAVYWGLGYTFLLWLATLYANRRGWYWKL